MSRAFNPSGNFALARADAAHFGRNGGKSKSMTLKQIYMIEGETVTGDIMGARLGVTSRTAIERLKIVQKYPGPVTWDALHKARAR